MATNDFGDGFGVEMRCSFCGKTRSQVSKLIAGPGGVYICDECVHACWIASVEGTTLARPIRWANAERVDRGADWDAAQERASKTARGVLGAPEEDGESLGRAFRCCAETWASLEAVFATLRCA